MTSRERVVAALSHRAVDRVPVDFGGTRQSGMSVFSYVKLRERLGLARAPVRVFDVYQMLAEIEPEVVERAGGDCVGLNRRAVAFGIVNEGWKRMTIRGVEMEVPGGFSPEADGGDLVIRRGGEVIARMPEGGFYFDRYEKYPGASHPDLATWVPPRVGPEDFGHFAREACRLTDETDKAVVVAMGPPYELFNGMGQGGFEEWMVTFASEDEYVETLYTKLVDAWIENLAGLWEAVGEQVAVLQFCDDLGTQAGPFLSTGMFRERVMGHYARGLRWVHKNTPWKVLMHTDGAIRPLIASLVEMGVDALNPIQMSCPGMGVGSLRAEWKGRLAFWGASCDAQGTLGRKGPGEVRAECEKHLEALSPLDGGVIYASVHNVQADVAPENELAMFDAARDWGKDSPQANG